MKNKIEFLVVGLLLSFSTLAPASAVDCFQSAWQNINVNGDAKVLLDFCRGASNDAPVRCFLRSWNEINVNGNQAKLLKFCKGATDPDAQPDCFKEAWQKINVNGNVDVLLDFCSPLPSCS